MGVILTIATTMLEELGAAAGVAAAKKAGFAAIEIALSDNVAVTRDWANAAKAEGLAVAGVATQFVLHHEKTAAWADAKASIEKTIDLAAEIGAGYVRVFGLQVGRGESRTGVLTRLGTRLGELAAYAAGKHVHVVLENAGSFVHSKELWQIVEVAGCATGGFGGVCWNVAEAAKTNESPVLSVPTLNTRLKVARLYDTTDGKPVAPGQGTVKLKSFAERLRGIGFDGPVVLSAGITTTDAAGVDAALAEAIHTIKGWFNMLPPPPPPPPPPPAAAKKPEASSQKPAATTPATKKTEAAPTAAADSAPTPQRAPETK